MYRSCEAAIATRPRLSPVGEQIGGKTTNVKKKIENSLRTRTMDFSDEETGGGRNDLSQGDEGGYRSDEAQEEPSGQNDDGDGEGGKARRIDPATSKKRVTRNPQPKLNAERIQGPKGVQTIERYFEGFKFHGKGKEKADLDRVMKRLEHWAHRLFPKYRFEDFLEKMENLGSKKNVQVFLKKYRLDMIRPDDDANNIEDDEAATREDEVVPEEAPVDEFDKLIAEQIEKQRQVANEPPKQLNKPAGYVLGSASTAKPSELSEEVRARIEANRKLAIERKMARLRREEESRKQKSEESLGESRVSSSTDVSGGKDSSVDLRDTRNEISTTEKIDSTEAEGTAEDFGERQSRENAEEETKKRKAQDMEEVMSTMELEGKVISTMELEEKVISTMELEETPQRIEEFIDKESPSEDLPFVSEEREARAIEDDVVEVPASQFEEHNSPKVNEQSSAESKLLTHEELLMEIDGAMEEIINKSTRRSL